MPKNPQDHKRKAEDEPEAFSFTGPDGETYSFKPTKTVLNPGFIRRHRHAGEGDIFYTLIEQLADEDVLEAFDTLSFEANASVIEEFGEHVKALMGTDLGK